MSNEDYKPWEIYPHFWKTESEFWSYLRGCLRRGIWEKSPIKLKFKNTNCSPPPENLDTRAKSGQYCALTGEWAGKSKLEVDHVEGHVSLLSWNDVLPFILHLIPEEDNLQLVNKEAHKIKNYAERMGIPFQEALIEKQAIAICKEKRDKEWLIEKGLLPAKNAKKRRQQIVEYLKRENNG